MPYRISRDKVTRRFKDDDIARILHDATEVRAGAFKARGIPECLRVIEILGIMQSRGWGACSVRCNSRRRYLQLTSMLAQRIQEVPGS